MFSSCKSVFLTIIDRQPPIWEKQILKSVKVNALALYLVIHTQRQNRERKYQQQIQIIRTMYTENTMIKREIAQRKKKTTPKKPTKHNIQKIYSCLT